MRRRGEPAGRPARVEEHDLHPAAVRPCPRQQFQAGLERADVADDHHPGPPPDPAAPVEAEGQAHAGVAQVPGRRQGVGGPAQVGLEGRGRVADHGGVESGARHHGEPGRWEAVALDPADVDPEVAARQGLVEGARRVGRQVQVAGEQVAGAAGYERERDPGAGDDIGADPYGAVAAAGHHQVHTARGTLLGKPPAGPVHAGRCPPLVGVTVPVEPGAHLGGQLVRAAVGMAHDDDAPARAAGPAVLGGYGCGPAVRSPPRCTGVPAAGQEHGPHDQQRHGAVEQAAQYVGGMVHAPVDPGQPDRGRHEEQHPGREVPPGAARTVQHEGRQPSVQGDGRADVPRGETRRGRRPVQLGNVGAGPLHEEGDDEEDRRLDGDRRPQENGLRPARGGRQRQQRGHAEQRHPDDALRAGHQRQRLGDTVPDGAPMRGEVLGQPLLQGERPQADRHTGHPEAQEHHQGGLGRQEPHQPRASRGTAVLRRHGGPCCPSRADDAPTDPPTRPAPRSRRPRPVVSGLPHPPDPGWAAGCGRSRPSRAAVPSTGTR